MAEPYESFVELFSIFDLNLSRLALLPFSCVLQRQFDHLDSVISVSLTPIALYAIGIGLVRLKYAARDRERVRKMMTFYFVRLLLLGYPAISRTICQSFRCDIFDAGEDGSTMLLVSE